jgi:acyl-CoA reductase-like NAD-dependent aldehyde dehydrogenase
MDMQTVGEPRMTIGGRAAVTTETVEVINPATAEPFVAAPVANRGQVNDAVAAAKAALPAWSATPIAERQAKVREFAARLRENIDILAHMLTSEQGKPINNARGEINGAIATMESYCDLDLDPIVLRDKPEQFVELRRRPLGPVAAITAWNYPVLLLLWKLGPCLVAGNTVVVKPAIVTPVATLKVGEIANQVFPAGVVNVINGGNDVGAALVTHPDIRKVAFTGSTATGKRIMADAAPTLKRLTLELGGNDAGIVLADVDPRKFANDIFWAKFSNCGQVCAALKRLFVPDTLHDALIAELIEVANSVKIGDGFTDGIQMGPIQNAAQHARLVALVEDAKAKGATVLHEGTVPEGSGYWFPITLLGDVPPNADIVHEEAFGPILTVYRYQDPEDALARANASNFGLGASVWTSDVGAGAALAERMEAGSTWVNQHPSMGPDIPFGGVKHSGLGVEGARWGLEEYTSIHVVNVKKVGP